MNSMPAELQEARELVREALRTKHHIYIELYPHERAKQVLATYRQALELEGATAERLQWKMRPFADRKGQTQWECERIEFRYVTPIPPRDQVTDLSQTRAISAPPTPVAVG